MEFKKFTNGADYLEYIQIYLLFEILVSKKQLDEVNIDGYEKFEITDKMVAHYDAWIDLGCPNKKFIEKWADENAKVFNAFKEGFGTKYKPKVVIWSDRKKTDYYKQKLQDAFIFENYIAKVLQDEHGLEIGQYLTPEGQYNLGENALGIEIKNDTLIERYGNVYIEYQEKSRADRDEFVNSGILKNDNCKYFLIGTEDKFYIFKKERLIEIYHEEIENRKQARPSEREIAFKTIKTSKGFAYPVRKAIADTISIAQMVEEIKNK